MRRKDDSSEQAPRSPNRNVLVRVGRSLRNMVIVGSVASCFANMHWIADFLSHLRIQYAIILLPCVVHSFIRRKWTMASIVCGFFIYNVLPTVPYFLRPTSQANAHSSKATQYRVLSFNVLRTNERLESTLEEIVAEDADFVFLMEVQNEWRIYLEGINDRYPYQKVLSDPAYTGVAFLSKYPWEKLDVIMLGEVSNPSIDVRLPSLDSTSEKLRLIATHPLPPLGEMLTRSRDQQLTTLGKRFLPDEPNLMIGDLNLSPWSSRFATILSSAGLMDASLGYGISPTLCPLPTWFGGVKVDHVLISESIKVRRFRVQPSRYSDHAMVVVDFAVGM
jgi:endonuclease/exonuclease/phosphatase (EEP) superfamily protein YafD